VPVTAKLSKKFYDTLGDEVTNELVAWLNAVDDSYRTEFRDLFAANFGRLEAEMRALEARLQAELRTLEARVEARFDRFEARMLRWMLVFWAGTMGTVIALLKL
jgi:hypothetical protein